MLTIIIAIIVIIHEIVSWHNSLVSHKWYSKPTAIEGVRSQWYEASNGWWLWKGFIFYCKTVLIVLGTIWTLNN